MCSNRRGNQLDYAAWLLLHAADSHQQMDAQTQLRQLGYRLQEAGWLGIFGVSTSAQSAPGDDWSVPPFAIPSGDQTWEWKIPSLVRWFSHSTSMLRDFPAVPGTVPGALRPEQLRRLRSLEQICCSRLQASFSRWWRKSSGSTAAGWRMVAGDGWGEGGPSQGGDLPSGKHTKSYWKWPFIVDFPIENGDFP